MLVTLARPGGLLLPPPVGLIRLPIGAAAAQVLLAAITQGICTATR